MAKHTQGPWGISSQAPHIIKRFDIFGETNVLLGSAMGGETSGPFFPENGEEVLANALLMAAAPDLLAALQSINDYWESGNFTRREELWAPMRAAIAKATGEPQ